MKLPPETVNQQLERANRNAVNLGRLWLATIMLGGCLSGFLFAKCLDENRNVRYLSNKLWLMQQPAGQFPQPSPTNRSEIKP